MKTAVAVVLLFGWWVVFAASAGSSIRSPPPITIPEVPRPYVINPPLPNYPPRERPNRVYFELHTPQETTNVQSTGIKYPQKEVPWSNIHESWEEILRRMIMFRQMLKEYHPSPPQNVLHPSDSYVRELIRTNKDNVPRG